MFSKAQTRVNQIYARLIKKRESRIIQRGPKEMGSISILNRTMARMPEIQTLPTLKMLKLPRNWISWAKQGSKIVFKLISHIKERFRINNYPFSRRKSFQQKASNLLRIFLILVKTTLSNRISTRETMDFPFKLMTLSRNRISWLLTKLVLLSMKEIKRRGLIHRHFNQSIRMI